MVGKQIFNKHIPWVATVLDYFQDQLAICIPNRKNLVMANKYVENVGR